MRTEPSALPHDPAPAVGQPSPLKLRPWVPQPTACACSGPRAAKLFIPSLMAGAFALLLSTTGCQATMPSQDQSASEPRPTTGEIVPNDFPLRFEVHQFGAHCYNTFGCTVVYNNRRQIDDAEGFLRPAPREVGYMQQWATREIGIQGFPSPAELQWRSLDGEFHEARVDFAQIFQDRIILHDVPEAEIPEGWAGAQRPEIHLEVNDRTVSVYMRTHIATRGLQDPNNRYSNFRIETVKAWSKTF